MALNTAHEAAIEKRRAEAWDLRVRGHSYRSISQRLGISVGQAFADIKELFERTRSSVDERVEHHRAASLARVDKVVEVLMPLVEIGDLDAMDRLDRFEKRRAALLGLDAPAKQEVTGKDGGPLHGPVIYVPPESSE